MKNPYQQSQKWAWVGSIGLSLMSLTDSRQASVSHITNKQNTYIIQPKQKKRKKKQNTYICFLLQFLFYFGKLLIQIRKKKKKTKPVFILLHFITSRGVHIRWGGPLLCTAPIFRSPHGPIRTAHPPIQRRRLPHVASRYGLGQKIKETLDLLFAALAISTRLSVPRFALSLCSQTPRQSSPMMDSGDGEQPWIPSPNVVLPKCQRSDLGNPCLAQFKGPFFFFLDETRIVE